MKFVYKAQKVVEHYCKVKQTKRSAKLLHKAIIKSHDFQGNSRYHSISRTISIPMHTYSICKICSLPCRHYREPLGERGLFLATLCNATL